MDGGDYFGVSDGQTRVIPGQKLASRKWLLISSKSVSGPRLRPLSCDCMFAIRGV